MRLAFIGGGTMGEAMLAGAIAKKVAPARNISVCEVVAARREQLASKYRVKTTARAREAVAGADLVVLAVKPQEFAKAASSIKGSLTEGQTVMSIMAGVRSDTIAGLLGHEAVVRAIPNTPSRIGEGMTVWTAPRAVKAPARRAVRSLLSVLGMEIFADDEKYIDMATAVSASGPAYVFLVIESLIDAAVHIGFKREVAVPMVLQTVLGSARYAMESGQHPADLRNQVTSPGGTTAEALVELEDAGLRATFARAVEAAYEKARELGS